MNSSDRSLGFLNRRSAIVATLVTVGVLSGSIAAAGARSQASLEVVASRLSNPRGIAVSVPGKIYVAEAGKGGTGCVERPGGGGEGPPTLCFGRTGAVTKIENGRQQRVVRGLPSLAAPGGFQATGPHDVVRKRGTRTFVTIGFGFAAAVGEQFGSRARLFGKLVRLDNGSVEVIADLAKYERRNNPDAGPVDPNPYGALVLSKRRLLVADAGGNDLLRVSTGGRVETVGVFPTQLVPAPPFLGLPPGAQIPAESVPTAVTVGHGGVYYVGELTGFPFPVGKARVWRVVRGRAPEVFAQGFTNIIDLTFGRDGSLYVLELFKGGLLQVDPANEATLTGALIRVAPDGTRTEIASGGLVAPGGIAVSPDGSIYVTNRSIFPDTGEVVRIRR